MIKEIEKRDGTVVGFEAKKITDAIAKAGKATGEFNEGAAKKISLKVLNLAESIFIETNKPPNVEEIQDILSKPVLQIL